MALEKPLKDIDSARLKLLGKVAWLYYLGEHTQAEIAEKLGISRVTVNRLIKEARDCGVVEIKVHTGLSNEFSLAQRLSKRYHLCDAVVVPSNEDQQELRSSLAKAAAEVLSQRLRPGVTVGVGVGRTIAQIPDYFHPASPIACRFTGLSGGLDLRIPGLAHNFEILARLASAAQGEAVYIPAPSYVTYAGVKSALLSESAVTQALQTARQSDVAIYSLGTAGYSALLFQFGQITEQDLEDMRQRQAAGDVLGRFFDSQGQELDLDLNQRIIGLDLYELKRIPLKILVAGGESKYEALKVAVQNAFCDILVTDTASAAWLLECPNEHPGDH